MKNPLTSFDLVFNLRKNMNAMILSFFIGAGISTIPFAVNLIENIRNNRIVLIELEMEMDKIKSICKSKDSRYTKLLNLGFTESAIKNYESCISKYN